MKIPSKRSYIKEPFITYSHICHDDIPKCVHQLDTQSLKVWWRHNNSDINSRQLSMKIPKKRNKIKRRSITYSHTWHIDTSKYVYWLDTHFVTVCWRYLFPNPNTIIFCDNFFSDIEQCCISSPMQWRTIF